MQKTDFVKTLTSYFSDFLPTTRGLSKNTIMSYRDVFKLLLEYMHVVKRIDADQIELRMLDRETIIGFLNWLETSRNVSISTRNHRLVSLQAFFKYSQYRYPDLMAACQDIIEIKPKKCAKSLVSYVDRQQLEALFSRPNIHTAEGRRDLTLMAVLYDSGARVQELIDLNVSSVRLEHPSRIVLTGKGNKSRQVPLMKNTCTLLDHYLKEFHRTPTGSSPLFSNSRKGRLSRSGVTYILKKYADMAQPLISSKDISPHILRHSKAMHLLQADINLIYIRDFLGHANITTTEVYARADDEMKRRVFEKAVPNYTAKEMMPWEEDESLMNWLEKLGKKQF